MSMISTQEDDGVSASPGKQAQYTIQIYPLTSVFQKKGSDGTADRVTDEKKMATRKTEDLILVDNHDDTVAAGKLL